jgi:transcription elongation factor Elf1
MEHRHHRFFLLALSNFNLEIFIFLALTEPIDVYSEWIDACQAANENAGKERGVHDREREEQDSEGKDLSINRFILII